MRLRMIRWREMSLAITLATRNRPGLLLETLAKTIPNIANADTVIHLMVDTDDALTIEALRPLPAALGPRINIDVRDREDTVAEKFNRVLEQQADVYLAMVDHTPHMTPGFDQKILEAAGLFPDGIGVVYNYLANASFPGVNALTRKMTDMLGYFYPPYFPYWFVDHWIDDLARLIGRISFADVITDSSKKQTTQEMREPAWWATFFDAGYMMRRQQAHNIVCATEFQEPHWRKLMLTAHAPLIEARSKWVNDSVRAQAFAYAQIAHQNKQDDRYRRIKAKAIAMLPGMLGLMPAAEGMAYYEKLMPLNTVIGLKRQYSV
jgi:hypothetical protein